MHIADLRRALVDRKSSCLIRTEGEAAAHGACRTALQRALPNPVRAVIGRGYQIRHFGIEEPALILGWQ